jgi:hypothetical protein
VILVSVNGDDHEPLAHDLAPHLADGQIVVLIQGTSAARSCSRTL